MKHIKKFNENYVYDEGSDLNDSVYIFIISNIDYILTIPDLEDICLRFVSNIKMLGGDTIYNNAYLLDTSEINIDKYIYDMQDFISLHMDERYSIKPVGEMSMSWRIPKGKYVIVSESVLNWLDCIKSINDTFDDIKKEVGSYHNYRLNKKIMCKRNVPPHVMSNVLYEYDNSIDSHNADRIELLIINNAYVISSSSNDSFGPIDYSKKIWVSVREENKDINIVKIENNCGIEPIHFNISDSHARMIDNGIRGYLDKCINA